MDLIHFFYLLIYFLQIISGNNANEKCKLISELNDINVEGNIVLRVLVDGHVGENCENSLSVGRTQIASISWIVNRLNQLHYLDPLKLGSYIYETCGKQQERVNLYLETILNETRVVDGCGVENQFLHLRKY